MGAVRRKAYLLKRAAKAGWAWAWDFSDHLGRVFTIIALLVGTSGITALTIAWWMPLVAVAAFALSAIAVGAVNAWYRAEQRVEANEAFQKGIAAFERRCYEHIEKVNRFLHARQVAGPPGPDDLATALREIGTPEAERRREESDKHGRETVAAFIESDHLDRGIGLIDFLIEWGFVNEKTRPHVAEPRTLDQISDGCAASNGALSTCPCTARR